MPLETGLQQFIIDTVKKLDSGEIPDYPQPADPVLNVPLTQDEINFIKVLRKQFSEQYTPTVPEG